MNDDIDSNELERQLGMLEGLNLDVSVPNIPNATTEPIPNNVMPTPQAQQIPVNNVPTAQPVETADTLLGNVPFGNVTAPYTPENPTNAGIVTNSVLQNANNFAAAQVVQPTTTVNPTQVVQQTAPVVADMNAAPVFVNLGESTYETKTDFLKLKEGESTRVTLINYNAVAVHEHFKEGLGFFKCKSVYEPGQRWPAVRAICCQQPNKNDPSKLENAGYKILLPVIEYPVNRNDGKTLIPDGTPKLKVIKLSQQEYNQLEAIRNGYGEDTSIFDISISRKKDTNGYLKYFLTPIPSWRAQFGKAIQEESLKLNNETYTTAMSESAKDISVEKLQQFFNEQRQQEQMAAQFANQPLITDPKSLGLNM